MTTETVHAATGEGRSRVRLAVLLGLLALSLVALYFKTPLQVWLYGVDKDLKALVGHQAPEIPSDVPTLAGEPFKLASLRGRVILLHFWTYG